MYTWFIVAANNGIINFKGAGGPMFKMYQCAPYFKVTGEGCCSQWHMHTQRQILSGPVDDGEGGGGGGGGVE